MVLSLFLLIPKFPIIYCKVSERLFNSICQWLTAVKYHLLIVVGRLFCGESTEPDCDRPECDSSSTVFFPFDSV